MILYRLSRCTCGGLQSLPAFVSSHSLEVRHLGRAIRRRQKGKKVRYIIDRMTMADVPRVVEIERLAYPSTWPPSAYRKELQDNRWAHYIVLRDKRITEERVTAQSRSVQEPDRQRRFFPLSLLPGRPTATASSPDLASIVGFAGL